jgi:hypothetical protein
MTVSLKGNYFLHYVILLGHFTCLFFLREFMYLNLYSEKDGNLRSMQYHKAQACPNLSATLQNDFANQNFTFVAKNVVILIIEYVEMQYLRAKSYSRLVMKVSKL